MSTNSEISTTGCHALTLKERSASKEQTQRDKKLETAGTVKQQRSAADLAKDINSAHEAVLAGHKKTLAAAMKCGKHLAEAKKKAGHGEWLRWLTKNCPQVSKRTASRYLSLDANKIKVNKAIKSATVADFDLGDAYRLIERLSKSDQEKEQASHNALDLAAGPEKGDSAAIQMFAEWFQNEYPEPHHQKTILIEIRNWIDAKLKEAA